jgi:uncharacterized membrane protein YjgN (DUF898 family)
MHATVAAAESAGESPRRETIPFTFTGTGAEYFRIWIVNLLLTLVTVGIYSAWAKVRRLRYFYGNTSIAGSAFEYHGKPLQILKGRLIAVAALILYSLATQVWPLTGLVLVPLLLIAIPWIVVRSRMFQMQMTSWRNIRFRFHGTYGGAAAVYLGWTFLAAITFYIMTPHLLYKRVRFLLGNTSYGSQRFEFQKTVGPYYALYYLTLLLALGAFIAAILLGFMLAGIFGLGMGITQAPAPNSVALIALGLVLAGVFIVTLVPIIAFFERRFVNTSLDGLRIGPHTVHCQLETNRLAGIYITNLLGMIVTLGLFYPWARIRRMRYQFESMSVETVGSLDRFVAAADQSTSATGEELGEFFDVDFGF